VKYVDSIARGRVWTGVEAKKLGLVDELGGLDVALRLAADEAGVEHYSVIVYPREKDAITQLMEIIGDEGLTMKYEIFNPDVEVFQNWIEKIANMESVQARLPYYIDF
jgi:protease-4